MTRVVLAEDEVLLREGLAALLTRFDFEVVAAVGSAPALLDTVRAHEPDLVVTDVRMPPNHRDDGLRAAVALRAARPHLAVVVLSQYVQAEYASALLDSGDGRQVGYLLKDRVADVAEFADTLRRVAAGGTEGRTTSPTVPNRTGRLSEAVSQPRQLGDVRRPVIVVRDVGVLPP